MPKRKKVEEEHENHERWLVSAFDMMTLLFVLFVGYALSGYAIYVWRRAKGHQVSIVSTSTDEPDERGLHHD